jgi:hypothetical protein
MTDGGLWVLDFFWGGLCCGVGAGTKETTSTTRCTDKAFSPGPTGTGECGVEHGLTCG